MRACLGREEVAMSDSETPKDNPERDGAPASSIGEPENGSPQQPGQSSAPSAIGPQSPEGGSRPTMPASSRRDRLGRMKHLTQGRKCVWAGAAVLCIAAGTIGSVLGAHAVARNDAANARPAFQQSSAGIASTLKLA